MRSLFLPKCKQKINKDHSTFGYDPFLFGWAEILVIFGLNFGRNDNLINSFWNELTFWKIEIYIVNFTYVHSMRCCTFTRNIHSWNKSMFWVGRVLTIHLLPKLFAGMGEYGGLNVLKIWSIWTSCRGSFTKVVTMS